MYWNREYSIDESSNLMENRDTWNLRSRAGEVFPSSSPHIIHTTSEKFSMATARSCHQPSISRLRHPPQQSSFSPRKGWISISPPGAAAGGARCSSGGDFSPGEKRTAAKKAPRAPRRLITISTADGRWQGEWYCDFVYSLRELGVADVADLGQADSNVLISLVVQKV